MFPEVASPDRERFSVSFAQPMYCHGEALVEDAAADGVTDVNEDMAIVVVTELETIVVGPWVVTVTGTEVEAEVLVATELDAAVEELEVVFAA